MKQRKPQLPTPVSPSAAAAASGNDRGKSQAGGAGGAEGEQQEKKISPELRHLLSRKVERLDKKEVKQHGGGIGS